jgi:hypothetical protein
MHSGNQEIPNGANNRMDHRGLAERLPCPGAKRCYLLDTRGLQQGQTAFASGYEGTGATFNPLLSAEGASWSHREYFRNAVSKPGEIHLSRPYVALPDTARTVTVSHMTFTYYGYRILCLDIHPEQAFPGSHHHLPHHI